MTRPLLPFVVAVIGGLLLALAALVGRWTAPTSTYEPPPAAARADADIRTWAGDQGKVTLFQRNSVVFNYTIGLDRFMARQASAWYMRAPSGHWHLAGVQWFRKYGG